jgi:hypothetical protein
VGDVNSTRPNPRLQRTPSASPPSPLSRQPLGRAFPLLLLIAAAARCESEAHWTGISINAMEEWVDATVSIDGTPVGNLQFLALHDSAYENWLKKKDGDSPLFHAVALNVPFNPGKMRAGVHTIQIAKPGLATVQGEFTFPDPRGSSVQFVSINGQSLSNSPGPDAHGSHP